MLHVLYGPALQMELPLSMSTTYPSFIRAVPSVGSVNLTMTLICRTVNLLLEFLFPYNQLLGYQVTSLNL